MQQECLKIFEINTIKCFIFLLLEVKHDKSQCFNEEALTLFPCKEIERSKDDVTINVMRRLVNIIYNMIKNKTEYVMQIVGLKEAV